MQEHEVIAIEEINENDLQSITGGCGACEPDRQIVREVADKIIRRRELRRQGAPLPADLSDEQLRRDTRRGDAALARIAERHPPMNPNLKRILPMHEFI